MLFKYKSGILYNRLIYYIKLLEGWGAFGIMQTQQNLSKCPLWEFEVKIDAEKKVNLIALGNVGNRCKPHIYQR
jgi:hypothetical protein